MDINDKQKVYEIVDWLDELVFKDYKRFVLALIVLERGRNQIFDSDVKNVETWYYSDFPLLDRSLIEGEY